MKPKIEVFKTNVKKRSEARKMIGLLQQHFPGSKINFDLQDCDKILRVEGNEFAIEKILTLVKAHGFYCDILE